MPKITFISNGEIYIMQGEKPVKLKSQVIEKYNRNIREIQKRKQWKEKEDQMSFLRHSLGNQKEVNIKVSDVNFTSEEQLIYSTILEETSSVYKKSVEVLDDYEEMVVHASPVTIFDINYSKESGKIAVSFREDTFEVHIATLDEKTSDYKFYTDGESVDRNPFFDPKDVNVIYYDSAGIAMLENGQMKGLGARSIVKLDLTNRQMTEFLEDSEFNFFNPQIDDNGNFYYLKSPYKGLEARKVKFNFMDIVLAPFKIVKGIIGWLDFFTQRYAGENLKTSGNNPAKTKPQTKEELFIEGNLINVERAMKESSARGDKFPGIAPSSIVLVRQNEKGETATIKKGVMDYAVCKNGDIIYSNGKNIIKINNQNEETIICKIDLATKIRIFE